MQKFAQVLPVLLVNSALLGIVIVILELIFGNWLRPDNLNQLNIVRSQTIPFVVDKLYPSATHTITYSRDQYGLRGSFKRPGEIDILTVGGSTTDQRYIADGYTWQDVLQQRFASIGKKVVVANAGVDGQSTIGHIKDFDWWFPYIPELKPRYVLFYIGINDFYVDEGNSYDAMNLHVDTGNSYDSMNLSWHELLSERSALYYLARTLRGIYRAEIEEQVSHRRIAFNSYQWVQDPLVSSYDELMNTRLKEYAERLNVLIAKTERLGSVPIFVTQPSHKYRFRNGIIEGIGTTASYDNTLINGVDFYYMMRKLDHVTCSVAQVHNILCIDLAKESFWQDDDFYDFGHMTPKGVSLVGTYLFARLKDKL